MSDWGTLYNHRTGDPIRPATAGEWRKSADALASRYHTSSYGVWRDDDNVVVFVSGGPDDEVNAESIRQLLAEAGLAGDEEMARLCKIALDRLPGDDDAAWRECARVILDNRMNSVA